MNTENTVRWVAGLSNGETLVEGKGICIADTELSAWGKLQKHLKDNDLTINSFQIRVGDKQFNLPNNTDRFSKMGYKGCTPIAYDCFRSEWHNALGSGDGHEEYIHAHAIYEDFTVQVWVDLSDTNKSWINIIN